LKQTPIERMRLHISLVPLVGLICLVRVVRCALTSTETVSQCTAEQAAEDGRFACLDGCDENHMVDGWLPYCLSYFPDEGLCYMKPYAREDVMTCNGQNGVTDPPMWLVSIGGSNNYMMFKVMVDMMLELPPDAGYDPKRYWNATGEYLTQLPALLTSNLYCLAHECRLR
jgi:hypothetical protein